jgi:ferrous iron transport protein A
MAELTLDALEPGQKAVITSVKAEGSGRKRIAEMGLSKGTGVEMIRRAPLNDPIEFRVRGYCISLRKSEACAIVIDKVEG